MKLFGKEMTENEINRAIQNAPTDSERKSIQEFLCIQRQMIAEDRMNCETNPVIKEQMRRLIAKKIYNFDYLFGPVK